MKRATTKDKLKRRLQLVRSTIRELVPEQLEQVNGGATSPCAAAGSLCNTYPFTGG
jgi:hypothetical protein